MSIDRQKASKQVARVMNQVAESEQTVARHREAMAELERASHDVDLARKMLIYVEYVHSI
jgi:hypothetical protein